MDAQATPIESNFESLIQSEWVIVFYPTTCALRLHPTLHAAQASIAKLSWPIHIYRSPADFRLRHDHLALERFWRGLYAATMKFGLPKYATGTISEHDATPPDLPTEAFCKSLWDLMERVGDRVIRLSTQFVRSKEHYEVVGKKIQDLMADEELFRDSYPKQARIILDALNRQESPYLLEADLMKLMNHLVAQGKLKTKQDSWRIFQYYRPQFIDNGLLVRGDEATETEDED